MATDTDALPFDERRVVMRRGTPIVGVVLASNGEPTTATVQVRGPWRGEIKTTESGQWEFLAIAGTYELAASSASELPCTPIAITHDGSIRTEGVVVRTANGAELALTVVDESNAPSPDAIAFLVDVSERHQLPRLWRCDDDGRVSARGIVSGSYKLFAAIARASAPAKDVQVIRSTETDKRHAAFAPMVDVFTCDKRIQPVVAKVISASRPGTTVVRTNTLERVVAAISA